MTLRVNLTLTCYYFETAPGYILSTKMADLPCKPNSDLLLSRDVNSPRLCFVNKDGGGVNDLPRKPNSDLLLSRGVNSPRLCYVNNEVDSVTLYLTCYGKQRRHFEF